MRLVDGAVFEVTGEGFAPVGEIRAAGEAVTIAPEHQLTELALAGALCNEADLHQRDGTWVWRGDPTDLALLALAHKLGRDPGAAMRAFPKAADIPFESERQFAASYHRDGERTRVFAKGAPERVLGMCAWQDAPDQRAVLLAAAEEMAANGYRVLAWPQATRGPRSIPADCPTSRRGCAASAWPV